MKGGDEIVRIISSCFQCWHILCTRIQRQGKVKRKLAAFFTGIALFVFVTWKFIYVYIRLDRKVKFAGCAFPLHYVQWKAVASRFWHSSFVYIHFGFHVTSRFLFAPNFQRNVVGNASTAMHNDNNIQQTNRGNAPNSQTKIRVGTCFNRCHWAMNEIFGQNQPINHYSNPIPRC